MKKIQPGSSKKSANSTSDDILHRLAFNKSFQPNIISVVGSGRIILANMAACKLLGYSKKELLTKDRSSIFKWLDINFKKMLRERMADGHSIAAVTLIKKNGALIPCEITSSVFMDGGVEKSITSITDMRKSILKQKNLDIKKEEIVAVNIGIAESKQKAIDIKNEKLVADDILLAQEKSDARLEGSNEWIKYIAKESYDVMWDLDIATGKLYLGDSVKEVFGYELKDDMMDLKDFISHIVPFEKEKVEKKLWESIVSKNKIWSDAFLFKRYDGSVASTTSRASIVRDGQGKAIRLIGAMQDVSRIQELEKQLKERIVTSKEQNDVFQLAAKLSYDGIWDWNLLTNDFYLGEGFEDLFGDAIKDRTGNILDWSKHLHPHDKVAVEKGLQHAIATGATMWEHTYRFIRANGSTAEVFGRANIIRDANGKAYRIIGAVHDIHKQTMLEEKLKQEINLREIQIAEATADAKDTERSDIGKELHDNVNQLLGASKMYLEMAKGGGESSAMYIGRSSEYTLLAIEEIRKLTKGLTTDIIEDLGLCVAIENTIRDMREVNPINISFSPGSFVEAGINNKFKLNLYRIVQEHLNNILKHANASEVAISLGQDARSIFLIITDNGVGFDTSKKQKGIGVENIKYRATTYKGKADFVSHPGQGCVLSVTFPLILPDN